MDSIRSNLFQFLLPPDFRQLHIQYPSSDLGPENLWKKAKGAFILSDNIK